MLKNEMVKKEQMLESFKALEELENRRYTYTNAVEAAENEIKASMKCEAYELPLMPQEPEQGSKLELAKNIFFMAVGGIIVALIAASILQIIVAFILGLLNVGSYFGMHEQLFLIIILTALIFILLFIPSVNGTIEEYNKPMTDYEEALNEWQENVENTNKVNKQIRMDARKCYQLTKNKREPDISEWNGTIRAITVRTDALYARFRIPERYQNAVAMHFFVTYLESGRCDTLKECMNKYDEDVQYYKLKGEIGQVYERICVMEGRLTSEIRSLKSSFESDMRGLSVLIERNSDQIERLNYNQETLDLLNRWNLLK